MKGVGGERRFVIDSAMGKVVRERRDVTDIARGKWVVRERRDVTGSAMLRGVVLERRDVTDSARGKWVVRE